METIKWHKLTCSFYAQPIGIRSNKKKSWEAITNFIKHHIGFNYTIEARYDEFPDDIVEMEWSSDTSQGWDIIHKKEM